MIPLILTGRHDRALEHCAAGLALCDAAGDQWVRSYLVFGRGAASWMTGDIDRARTDLLDSLRVKEAFQDQLGIVLCLAQIAGWVLERR